MNFVGGAKEIRKKILDQELSVTTLTVEVYSGKFKEADAHDLSWLLEAAVQSFKVHLRRVVGKNEVDLQVVSHNTGTSWIVSRFNPAHSTARTSSPIEVLTPGYFSYWEAFNGFTWLSLIPSTHYNVLDIGISPKKLTGQFLKQIVKWIPENHESSIQVSKCNKRSAGRRHRMLARRNLPLLQSGPLHTY